MPLKCPTWSFGLSSDALRIFSKNVFVNSGTRSWSRDEAIVLIAFRTELYSCLTLAVFFKSFTCEKFENNSKFITTKPNYTSCLTLAVFFKSFTYEKFEMNFKVITMKLNYKSCLALAVYFNSFICESKQCVVNFMSRG